MTRVTSTRRRSESRVIIECLESRVLLSAALSTTDLGMPEAPVQVESVPSPGSTARLQFEQTPTTVYADTPITPPVKVDLLDVAGNIVTGDSSQVTLSCPLDPGILGGDLTATADHGIATFPNVRFLSFGNYYLFATTPAIAPMGTSSANFKVNPPVMGEPVTISLNSANIYPLLNEPILVSARVQPATSGGPAPTGTVTFLSDGTTKTTVPLSADGSATATVTYSESPNIWHYLSATYNGDAIYERQSSYELVENLWAPSSLQASIVGSFPAKPIVAGKRLRLSSRITVTNTSNFTYRGSLEGTLYLSSSATVGSDAMDAVKARTRNLTIPPGRHTGLSFILPLRTELVSPGSYHLAVHVADTLGSATSVAATQTSFTIVRPQVDVTGQLVQIPAATVQGKKIAFALVIYNNGTISAAGRINLVLSASPTGLLDNGAVVICSLPKRIRISAGRSLTLRFKGIALPKGSAKYYLIAQLDPEDVLHDVNRSDNTVVSKSSIAIL